MSNRSTTNVGSTTYRTTLTYDGSNNLIGVSSVVKT